MTDEALDRALHPPFVTPELPGFPGRIREHLEDFEVEEVPAYPPAGDGDHLFVWLEKRDLTTPEAVKRLARALDVDPRAAGWAGLKDRGAVTRQWVSLEGATADAAARVRVDGLRVLDARPHRHKLRTGHLRANRFRLVLRGVPPDAGDRADAVLEVLRRDGMPNYFGPQRFGRDGETARRARAWLVDGGRPPRDRFARKLLSSALQSELFNATVADRLDRGLLTQPLRGDVLRKEDSGGLFICASVAEDAPRLAAWEISPTAPMWGKKARPAEEEAAAFEREVLGDLDLEALYARLGRAAPGTRRAVRVRPEVHGSAVDGDALTLDFTLPPGSYATVLVRELTKAG